MSGKVEILSPGGFAPESYSPQQLQLLQQNEVKQTFSDKSYVEFFVLTLSKDQILQDYSFNNYSILNDGQSALTNNFSEIIVDPLSILENLGFDVGSYITYFNFLDKKIGSHLEQLYIFDISSDRKEVKIKSNSLSNLSLIEQTLEFITERENSEYFLDFYLNFGDNNLFIANNLQFNNSNPSDPYILIKLYNPLPESYDINDFLWVVTTIEEPRAFQVTFDEEPIVINDTVPLENPNFNIDVKDQVNNSTELLSLLDLQNTPLTSSFNQIDSIINRESIDINIDYTEFDNFVHFSSATTRLENFYYKIGLLESYSSSISSLNSLNPTVDLSSSLAVYESKINNIIKNFDGYDYYLYYESSSFSWPKTTSVKPYELAKIDSEAVSNWFGSVNENSPIYGGLIFTASLYDNTNKDNLKFSIPEYLRDDPDNAQYELFIDMVAQHYDNLWIYHREFTQKYNADNRLEFGVSKDIVVDAIRDFGVKLYQNNFSNDDLYTAFLGLTPDGASFPFPTITGSLPTPTGFEYVNNKISASSDIIPLDNVNKSLYKRIYHNIPYLLKAKGTIPGLRALITSYGIPDTILRINEYGGKDKINVNDWDHWQREFNYAFKTDGNNFITSSWQIPRAWNSNDEVPNTIMFRFKTNGLPTSNIPYSQSLWNKGDKVHIVLRYTGSAYTSASYSGSTVDPYYQYAHLDLYPNHNTAPNESASIYLPFFDGGWWSVKADRNETTANFTLSSGNKIYEEGNNGTSLGFFSSSIISASDDSEWYAIPDQSTFATSSIINGNTYNPFSGSLQEIRYYASTITGSMFKDYIMNPHSIEGNSINSSPTDLVFRASLGGELFTGSSSIHPKVSGSWVTTQSFSGSGDGFSYFNFNTTPTFVPNTEMFFADQPIAGLRNIIKDKIRVENNVIPEGNTISPYMSLSQMANISQSYTPNINYLEVAFSPTNEINEDIMDQIGYFNIGEYIGDPRLRSSSATSYPDLDNLRDDYFEKYTKNYNLKDFIRLIKFFDNSLFKMIKDFVPARASLASGIVVKQHLLERNKYPQPQLFHSNLEISGTVKPQWNNYEEEKIVRAVGGTGGVFDVVNSTTTSPSGSLGTGPDNRYHLTQSWSETVLTLSGSVEKVYSNQDEFYDGEFSGSQVTVTTQNLNAGCDPYKKTNPRALTYSGIRVYSGSALGENYNFTSWISDENHPTDGYISMYYDTIAFPLPIPNPNS